MQSVIYVHFSQLVNHCGTYYRHVPHHTKSNILMLRYKYVHLNVKCHEVTLTVKLLIISRTLYSPQNRMIGTITHVTLSTTHGAVRFEGLDR
jgi:hypothetical protein